MKSQQKAKRVRRRRRPTTEQLILIRATLAQASRSGIWITGCGSVDPNRALQAFDAGLEWMDGMIEKDQERRAGK